MIYVDDCVTYGSGATFALLASDAPDDPALHSLVAALALPPRRRLRRRGLTCYRLSRQERLEALERGAVATSCLGLVQRCSTTLQHFHEEYLTR